MSDASSTTALLAEHNLSTYAKAFDERGWGSLTALQDISNGDLEKLITDVAMKSSHISRLQKALGKLPVAPAAAPPAVASYYRWHIRTIVHGTCVHRP